MLRDRLNTSLTVSHQFYPLAQKYLTSKYLVNLPSRQLIVYWKKWQIGFCNIAIVWQSLASQLPSFSPQTGEHAIFWKEKFIPTPFFDFVWRTHFPISFSSPVFSSLFFFSLSPSPSLFLLEQQKLTFQLFASYCFALELSKRFHRSKYFSAISSRGVNRAIRLCQSISLRFRQKRERLDIGRYSPIFVYFILFHFFHPSFFAQTRTEPALPVRPCSDLAATTDD